MGHKGSRWAMFFSTLYPLGKALGLFLFALGSDSASTVRHSN